MKKNNALKIIVISLVIAMFLTMIIPATTMDYLGNATKGEISPMGSWTILSNLSIAVAYFSYTAIYIIAIAVFYSVIGKTASFNAFIDKVVGLFGRVKYIFIGLSIIFYGILGALVSNATTASNVLILLVFVPFTYKVMSKMKIDNKAILASTIVASLIGAMCGIYDATLMSVFSIKINATSTIIRIVLLVLSLFVLITFVAPTASVEEDKAEESSKKPATKKAEAKTTTKKVAAKKAPAKKTSTKGRKKVAK